MEKKNFQKTFFKIQKESPDFPKHEEEVLKYWQEIKAFEKQLEHTKGLPEYTFYDGPPFATGTPHYGHICAGTIKDVITRYASMNGYHVERKFGWDCHGLPVEHEIDKTLGIKNRSTIVEMGIDKYNEECRSIVMRYSGLWREVVNRMGRWIDFENDYKTMDRSFMESVWWVFKQIYDKGLVYRGCKIMPYSTKCLTVLSNFEASQNYQMVTDPAVVVTFPLKEDPEVSFLAWTTTPWTLPSNLALAVNPNFEYVLVKDLKTGSKYILAKCRLVELYKSGAEFKDCENQTTQHKQRDKNKKKKKKKGKETKKPEKQKETQKVEKKEFEILKTFKGKDLEGKEYIPLFEYYSEMREKGCFKVLCGDYVTSDSGTGIVHTAPAFGEEDYRICRKYDIIEPSDPCVSIDEDGNFKDLVKEFKGMYVKDADPKIMDLLKTRKRLVKKGTIVHSYPMCWRSKTPLIYMAVNCWFIRVTELKEKLLVNNMKAKWIPEYAQTQRFQKWLENANDWCFSRTRYWGNPIPLWVSDDYSEVVCVGSVEELKKLANLPEDMEIPDLHMHKIKDITIPSKNGKGNLKRIPETFDCWFESGSMPYAQKGYPFNVKEEDFQKGFPADFIGEGLDQTRGWFYTLNVIGTALFDTCPYKNLIVNGIVLAKDGTKMSKSKKNYPDPMEVFNSFGADAVRLYLMNSPLVKGQELKFKEEGVRSVIKEIFLPWYYLCKLLTQEINRYENLSQTQFQYKENLFKEDSDFEFSNPLDKWILAKTQDLLEFVRQEFDNYRLYTVLKEKIAYLDQLSNWYVNMNKWRFKGENGPQDAFLALNVFYHCFFSCITVMAPYVPFIVEFFYQDIKKVIDQKSTQNQCSIHLLRIPQPVVKFEDQNLLEAVNIFQNLMTSLRKERELKGISKKQPLPKIVIHPRHTKVNKSLQRLETYLKEQGNIMDIQYGDDFKKYMKFNLLPNFDTVKDKLENSSDLGKLIPLIRNLKEEEIEKFMSEKKIELKYDKGQKSIILEQEDILVKCRLDYKNDDENQIVAGDVNYIYFLDCTVSEELRQVYLAREIINRIQRSRKKAGVQIEDKIVIIVDFEKKDCQLREIQQKQQQFIQNSIKKPFLSSEEDIITTVIYESEEQEVENDKFTVKIGLSGFCSLNLEEFKEQQQFIREYLQSIDPLRVKEKIEIDAESGKITLEKNKHFKVL